MICILEACIWISSAGPSVDNDVSFVAVIYISAREYYRFAAPTDTALSTTMYTCIMQRLSVFEYLSF